MMMNSRSNLWIEREDGREMVNTVNTITTSATSATTATADMSIGSTSMVSGTSITVDTTIPTGTTVYTGTYSTNRTIVDDFFERYLKDNGNKTCQKEDDMGEYWMRKLVGIDLAGFYPSPAKIKKIETYNGKVVKVTFEDGTFAKAVCSDDDVFSVDVGVTICILKKMLGKDGHKEYNKMMREVHDLLAKQEKEEQEERERKEIKLRRAKKAKEKAEQRRAKAREDYIDAHVEALRRWSAEKK